MTVAVLGINKSIEREGQDRYSLELPIDQQEFIKELYKVNPNTVVVLLPGVLWPLIGWTKMFRLY